MTQERGEARDAGVKLRISEAALAREVDHRHLVRRAAAMMNDPVVVTNGQEFLPRRLVPPASQFPCTMPGLALGPAGVGASTFFW